VFHNKKNYLLERTEIARILHVSDLLYADLHLLYFTYTRY